MGGRSVRVVVDLRLRRAGASCFAMLRLRPQRAVLVMAVSMCIGNWCTRTMCCDRAMGWAGVQSGRAQEKALQESQLRRKGGPQLQLAKARRPVSAP